MYLTHGDIKAKKLDAMITTDTERWRSQALPLVADGDRRDSKVRAELRRSIQQQEP